MLRLSSVGRRRGIAVVLALVLLPVSVTSAGTAQRDAKTSPRAVWSTIHYQTFEGAFPMGSWAVKDYNGAVGGDQWWGKSSGGYMSTWGAHPNASSSYADHTHAWLTYGPFSLAGASDADVNFMYWLDSEASYDYFTWSYSCIAAKNWTSTSVSGGNAAWKSARASLKTCAGKTTVYVRFEFVSDASFTDPGVWVDNVRIRKFS